MDITPDQRPIVVGYDASDCANVALEWAGHFAHGMGSPVSVLHSATTLLQTQGLAYGELVAEAEEKYADQIAQDGAERLRAQHPDLSVDTTTSLLGATIALDEASTSASLIVVGSHGRGRLRAVMLGSTAYALSGHARCPVVVVRDAHAPMPGPTKPIIVGSDGSVGSERAVDAAADLAVRWEAPLILMTSWTPPAPDPYDRPPFGYRTVAESLEALDNEATARNAENVRRVHAEHPGLDAQGVTMEIRPEDGLIEQGTDAALIVIGSRGHGTLLGALLGSTARSVLHQTTTPVMVVH